MEAGGQIKEKNNISYTNSLHTKHLQRSKYLKIDDNLLNIRAMNTNSLYGTASSKKNFPDPLTDDQIRGLKQEIRRVHVKYMK